MSRTGNKPIQIINGVKVKVDGQNISVTGPLGSLDYTVPSVITIGLTESEITFINTNSNSKASRALHGLTRALTANMVEGVSSGFQKELELVGVGYKVQKQGDDLNFSLGYSHPVVFKAPSEVTFEVPAQTKIVVKSIDKQKLGQTCVEIMKLRKVEPYKGKGVRFAGQKVKLKQGKSIKK